MSHHPVNLYINFVLHAVYGKMAEADELMRIAGDEIRSVAGVLAKQLPIAPAPLYRGMLLNPARLYDVDPRLTFQSWSEDRDVARWFAAPGSFISQPFAAYAPEARGFLVELPAPTSRVLFHHSWAQAFGGLAHLALQHPFMGREGHRQIAWSLKTQHEVIVEPVAITPVAVDDPSPEELFALDERLTPPWITRDESKSAPPAHRGVSQEGAY